MKRVFVTLIFALGVSIAIGQTFKIKMDCIGTKEERQILKLVEYSTQGDETAINAYSLSLLMEGNLQLFEKGDIVYATPVLFSGLLKVRRPGETKEWYVTSESIDR